MTFKIFIWNEIWPLMSEMIQQFFSYSRHIVSKKSTNYFFSLSMDNTFVDWKWAPMHFHVMTFCIQLWPWNFCSLHVVLQRGTFIPNIFFNSSMNDRTVDQTLEALLQNILFEVKACLWFLIYIITWVLHVTQCLNVPYINAKLFQKASINSKLINRSQPSFTFISWFML
jgi:hypothetical protein